jgi:hypothetical protein
MDILHTRWTHIDVDRQMVTDRLRMTNKGRQKDTNKLRQTDGPRERNRHRKVHRQRETD